MTTIDEARRPAAPARAHKAIPRERAHARVVAVWEDLGPQLQRGRELASTEARMWLDALTERIGDPAIVDEPALAPVLYALASESMHTADDALLAYWLDTCGLVEAVERLLAASTLDATFAKNGLGNLDLATRVLASGSPAWRLVHERLGTDAGQSILHDAARSADDATYGALVSLVQRVADDVPLPVRCDLLRLVPTETDRIDAAARESLALAPGEPFARDVYGSRIMQLVGAITDPMLADELLAFGLDHNPIVTLPWIPDAIARRGEAALPPLLRTLTALESDPKIFFDPPMRRRFARGVASIVHPDVATALARWLADTTIGPVAIEYLHAHPAQALAPLGAQLADKKKLGAASRSALESIVRSHPEVARAALDGSPLRATLEAMLAATKPSSAPTAPTSALPDVLRDPPWRRKGARPTRPVLAVPTPTYVDRVEPRTVAPTQREAPKLGDAEREALEAKLQRIVDAGPDGTDPWTRPWVAFDALDDATALRIWNEIPTWARQVMESDYHSDIATMLDRFGVAALPGVESAFAHRANESAFASLPRIDSPRFALVALRGLARRATRRVTLQWIDRHPRAAATGFISLALGPEGRTKREACEALRTLVERGHGAELTSVSQALGAEVEAAVDAVLAFDPLDECPKKPPSLSPFVRLDALPTVRLRDGSALDATATRNLVEMLQFSPAEPTYAGLVAVRGAFDDASLDALLAALVDAWIAAGAATANAWPMRALGHLGGDRAVRRLVPAIRRWPREKARPRALLGVEALARMDCDLTLSALAELARNGRNKHVEALAKERLEAVAQARGLDEESLADRVVPHLDLAADGSLVLDLGGRTFVARLQDDLTLRLFDGDKPLRGTPRVSASDDPVKGKEALQRLDGAKKDLVTIAKTLPPRLERAMTDGRRWDAASFASFVVAHPITGSLARRLLFGVFEGDGRGTLRTAFRVAEDRSLADVDDEPFALPEDANVGIVHPLELSEAARTTWSERFADYGIVGPFEQLGRAIATERGEARAAKLKPLEERELPSAMLLGRLTARGYRAGAVDGDGRIETYERRSPEATITIGLAPGLQLREAPPETLSIGVHFDPPITRVSAIAFSEVLFDLAPFA